MIMGVLRVLIVVICFWEILRGLKVRIVMLGNPPP